MAAPSRSGGSPHAPLRRPGRARARRTHAAGAPPAKAMRMHPAHILFGYRMEKAAARPRDARLRARAALGPGARRPAPLHTRPRERRCRRQAGPAASRWPRPGAPSAHAWQPPPPAQFLTRKFGAMRIVGVAPAAKQHCELHLQDIPAPRHPLALS
ncbi:MAG: hypothetical protein J3K34DRAFT_412737 [Monoraphidium minutum]|nr:MAG: hypothetical protein J3K34DRAFT_412737 [Monoraphidium minutum]